MECCLLSVDAQKLCIDLIAMPNLEFDIIIGMDFLSAYQALISCFKRQVVLFTRGGDYLRFKGDQLELTPSFLSHLGGKDFFTEDYLPCPPSIM